MLDIRVQCLLNIPAVPQVQLSKLVTKLYAEQREESGINHVENSEFSLSCIVSTLHSEKQLSTEDLSDIKTHTVLKQDRIPESQISSLVLGGHVQLSTNNSSDHDGVHGFKEDVPFHMRGDAKSPTAAFCPDDLCKENLAHGSEFVGSTSNDPGSKVAVKEMLLSSSKTPSGFPLLSGDNATADGVTLCEQGQNSQVTKLLGCNDTSQVATDLELVSLPESEQEQAAAIGCSTKVEVCSVFFDLRVKQVDGTTAACKSHEETLMEGNTEVESRVDAEWTLR